MATECEAGRWPLFIMFNYDKCVNVVPQAVHAAWVNIRGVHRVRGALNLCLDLCSLFVFALFPSRPSLFFEKVLAFAFRVGCESSCVLCDEGNWCVRVAWFVPVRPPSALA